MHSSESNNEGHVPRLMYSPPRLSSFGALAVLTAGGSKGSTEVTFKNMMNCGLNVVQKCG